MVVRFYVNKIGRIKTKGTYRKRAKVHEVCLKNYQKMKTKNLMEIAY